MYVHVCVRECMRVCVSVCSYIPYDCTNFTYSLFNYHMYMHIHGLSTLAVLPLVQLKVHYVYALYIRIYISVYTYIHNT